MRKWGNGRGKRIHTSLNPVLSLGAKLFPSTTAYIHKCLSLPFPFSFSLICLLFSPPSIPLASFILIYDNSIICSVLIFYMLSTLSLSLSFHLPLRDTILSSYPIISSNKPARCKIPSMIQQETPLTRQDVGIKQREEDSSKGRRGTKRRREERTTDDNLFSGTSN